MSFFTRPCLAMTLALALLTTHGTPAAQPTRALDIADQSAPAFQVFTAKDGLSEEIWSTVGFDQEGFVWAGSASGLARFDGYRFTAYPWPQAHSLVRDMANDPDGGLWAIFEREGLAGYQDGRWTRTQHRAFAQRFSPIGLSPGNRQLALPQENRNLFWTRQGWLDAEPSSAGLPAEQIKLERTERLFGAPRWWNGQTDGSLWFRTTEAGSRWQRFDSSQFTDAQITDLLVTEDRGQEELWLLTYGGGVVRFRADGVRHWRAETGELPSEAVYSAVATHDASGARTLWMASRGGLIRVQGDQTRTFDRRHGLPSNAVRGIKVQRSADGEDVLWLATEGGVARARISASPWQTVSLTGAAENGVFGLLVEPNDQGGERLWVGSAKDGLAMLENKQWHYFNSKQGNFPEVAVRGIWRSTGLDGKPLRIVSLAGLDPLIIRGVAEFSRFPTPWTKNPSAVLTSLLARQTAAGRELWFGTLRSGVYRLDSAGWEKVELSTSIENSARLDLANKPAAPPDKATHAGDWAVFAMTEQIDQQARSWLWMATDLGIVRSNGEQMLLLNADDGIPSGGFRSVTLIPNRDGDPVLWWGSLRNGVTRLNVKDPERPIIVEDDGLPTAPDPTVYSVLSDSRGRVYICTNNGVQQLTPNPSGGYDERVFRRRDGLVHDECNTNGQMIDDHDRYWVGTLGGLSMFDPAVQPAAQTLRAKPLRLTHVAADGAELSVNGGGPFQVPAGTRELRIDYVLLSGNRESESKYRSRLEPLDEIMSDWAHLPGRSFGGLPPGHYRLTVEAVDYSQTRSQPLHIEFELLPLWWQQRGIQWLALLLGLMLLGAAVLLYNRRLRAHRRELMRLVKARTAELDLANAQLTELSYRDPLTQLANRRRLMEALQKAIAACRQEGKPIGLILIDIDFFKEYNDRHGHLAGDSALRAVGEALNLARRERDLVARYGGEEFVCLMEHCELDAVTRVAERMRQRVAEIAPRSIGNDEHGISLSAGCVCRVPSPSDTCDSLLQDADIALYQAKHLGRNQVRVFEAKKQD